MMLLHEIFKVLTGFALGAFVLCISIVVCCYYLVIQGEGSTKYQDQCTDMMYAAIQWTYRTAIVSIIIGAIWILITFANIYGWVPR